MWDVGVRVRTWNGNGKEERQEEHTHSGKEERQEEHTPSGKEERQEGVYVFHHVSSLVVHLTDDGLSLDQLRDRVD